ncbi:DUF599 domain-containing protein [Thiolinea disciformis]|uniref:DUF599 domain-containing protein n=1 Tax=Thiolinea disciformis TaxID=125614 RepID=UPI00037C050D|nr:DUF599 domain-containing protein [Thiolinea disciformis]
MKTTEASWIIAAILILVSYHTYLVWMVKRHPLHADIGINTCVRQAWVQAIMQRQPGDVLAVQTLRNALMSASFLASTAILLVAGLLSFILTNKGSLESFNKVLDMLEARHPDVLLSQLLLLVVTFFFAFFNFALSVRYYNHVGFMLNAVDKIAGHILPETFMTASLQRAAFHFMLGMRAFLMILPFGLWLLGGVWFLLGSVLLVIILWRIDFPSRKLIHTTQCQVNKN